MNNPQKTAERIKSLAKSKNVSVSKMLLACEMNKNGLYTMQSSGYFPRVEALAKIADYLDCSVDYLLGRTDLPHLIVKDSNGKENFVLIEAMSPNKNLTDNLRIAAAPNVTPAKANQDEEKINRT